MISETSRAYQVERSKFDQILLDNTRHTGVDVREQHTVTDVIEAATGVFYESSCPSTTWMRSSIVKHAMQEGAKEQARVLLGQDSGPETPLFDGGLVASPDGLSWSLPR
jgi:flavin-dependent dehydrogenase